MTGTENEVMTLASQSVDLSGARDTLVDRLAASESLLRAMPVSNGFFSQLPAQQDGLTLHLARKVEQPNIEILDLHADGVDFRNRIFRALLGLGALRLAARQRDHVEKRAAIQINAMLQGLLLGVDLIQNLLRRDGGAQQRLQHWQ
jgi:hypothetical protein